MTSTSIPPRRNLHRPLFHWAVLFCVLIAVSLVGMTSTVVTLLGNDHTHTRSDISEVHGRALEDFRRADHQYDTLGPTRPQAQAHAHLLLQRHHHDRNDATVQSIDAGADDALGDGAVTPASCAFAMMANSCGVLTVAAPQARLVHWSLTGCPTIPNGHVHRLERPPRT